MEETLSLQFDLIKHLVRKMFHMVFDVAEYFCYVRLDFEKF